MFNVALTINGSRCSIELIEDDISFVQSFLIDETIDARNAFLFMHEYGVRKFSDEAAVAMLDRYQIIGSIQSI